ncbi:MAG: hypothetical protein WBN72_05135 [Nitrososphaeraceae archaeon]
MKVRVYFCKELDIQSIILRNNKISGQALDTVLVSESEFKNIVNVGKIWIKFIEEEKSIWNIIKKKRLTTK